MREIPLTKGHVALVDEADYERVSALRWYAMNCHGRTLYAARGRVLRSDPPKKVLMHRFILGVPAGMVIDHINGNGLDNRRANLRVCSHLENCGNGPARGTSSGHKNISYRPQHKRKPYVVQITRDGKNHYCGSFADLHSAVAARNTAVVRIWGEFARIDDVVLAGHAA